MTFGSGFGPGSERFCQVQAHPGRGTEPRTGSGRFRPFRSGPKFRTKPQQPYSVSAIFPFDTGTCAVPLRETRKPHL